MSHNVRLRLEEREETFSPYAAKSKLARRDRPESPCPMRTEFQRDRDRIIHSKAFRRLKHKTQVFIAPLGDHYVTRLTHTLEVSQIARTIARALNLNEDLAEAISLGHDLGHTPFGHVGEDVLNEIFPEGFAHNEQSLRVVEVIENEGHGLNLTREVREGILKHSKSRAGILGKGWEAPKTLEGQICKLADSIAYVNHDIGDAIRAGLIVAEDLPEAAISVLGQTHSARINTLVTDVVEHSWAATGFDANEPPPLISLSPTVLEAMNMLRDFLFKHVYDASATASESDRAREIVRDLYKYYIANPARLPPELPKTDGVERSVVDYIAGMTDLYALRMAQEVLK
ncbi:MAG: deoxyguanosinetriphosphate triphosphohydrolase [Chloroflexi bacterium]|nr:deoxyguanosinetriphosphate triphosphohydrolase [Chloroflexota bacterium]